MTPLHPLAAAPPVAGGVDLDLPGHQVRLRATRWPGSGPAVLLLHGLASTRRTWDLVVPHLLGPGPQAPAVVALDQRGHGDSERPAGPYDGGTVVRDVVTALDALALSRVVVVGHSWGAWTALRLAADAPERVLAAVAVDGGLSWERQLVPDRAELRRRMTPPRTALPPDLLSELLRRGPLEPWWSDTVERAVLSVFGLGDDGLARARLPFDAHMQVVDDLLDVDADSWLDRARCPVWLVGCSPPVAPGRSEDADEGARRPARRAALEAAEARLSRPRVLEWAGAVHDVPLQWPALVAGLIRAARDETVWAARTGEGSPA